MYLAGENMPKRVGEKRSRSTGGRESDPKAPPRKLSRVEEEDLDEGDSPPEFSFSQVGAQSQDELEAEQRTKEMKMVSGDRCSGVVKNNRLRLRPVA